MLCFVDEGGMTGWEWQKGNKLDYLYLPEWLKFGVTAVFSGRNGGVSTIPYSSLNLAFHVNDNLQDVLTNRKLFLDELGYSADNCVAAQQVHSNRVVEVTEAHRGMGILDISDALPECDGMVTSGRIALIGFFADCVPLYFYNPAIKMTGLAHAGWRGTSQGIGRKILAKFEKAGGLPEDCLAAIGPSIGSCCYEVGESVAEYFRENSNKQKILTKGATGRYYLDLVKANQIQLIEGGIRPENISVAGICTACHADSFYSYRRDGITGRMAAFIAGEGL